MKDCGGSKLLLQSGWVVIANHLNEGALLQDIVDMGGAQLSWTNSLRKWGKSLFAIRLKASPMQAEDLQFY